MKSTRIILTIAGVLTMTAVWAMPKTGSPNPPQGGGSTEVTTKSTKTTKSTQTQATLNSNPRQTPYTVPVAETSKAAAPRSERNGEASAFSVGEKVTICRDSTRYMTGEKISTWVYEAEHMVRQVNSKHHPNGILLGGINSWVYPGSLEAKTPATPSSEKESAVPAQEQPAAPAELAQVTEPTESTQTTNSAETAESTQATESTKTTQTAEATETTVSRSDSPLFERGGGIHRFTVGLRGGYANNMSKATDAKHPFGYDAMLDLQYAHYWAKAEDKCQLGLLVGIGAGYLQNGLQQALNEQFTANTSDGNILYTVTADEVKDKTGQVQLEVPVMFSMITPKGFFLNAGPRILLPVYTPSHQTVTNPDVDAYFEEEGVHVVNETVTGVVSDAQQDIKATTANNLKVNILLGAELGYEFRLQSGHSIGLGAYANYGLWNAFKGNGDGKVFNLTAPEGANTAVIDIETLTNAKATKMGYLDAGVKLTFNMNWRK